MDGIPALERLPSYQAYINFCGHHVLTLIQLAQAKSNLAQARSSVVADAYVAVKTSLEEQLRICSAQFFSRMSTQELCEIAFASGGECVDFDDTVGFDIPLVIEDQPTETHIFRASILKERRELALSPTQARLLELNELLFTNAVDQIHSAQQLIQTRLGIALTLQVRWSPVASDKALKGLINQVQQAHDQNTSRIYLSSADPNFTVSTEERKLSGSYGNIALSALTLVEELKEPLKALSAERGPIKPAHYRG